MTIGIVLVHGYTGSPQDLEQLAQKLTSKYGNDSVTNICLPGHNTEEIPSFDQQVFADLLISVIDNFIKENRKIILLGHSTGGSLLLSVLSNTSIYPDLLILASVPKKIDSGYYERWNKHRSGKENIPFSSIAEMILMIKNAGSKQLSSIFPVLILHGQHDNLVPLEDFYEWKKNSFKGYTRSVMIPSAKHDIFSGINRDMAIDEVMRTISDIAIEWTDDDDQTLINLAEIEEELNHFLAVSPLSKSHLTLFPGGKILSGMKPSLGPFAENDPIHANIEITTRCNLKCKYCARTTLGKPNQDMPFDTFCHVLDRLPHAYRITIVGLGEPLLHPQVIDIISEAVKRRRRVALVTNAMSLNTSMSSELVKAGLHSIAFSIDGPNQDTASFLRAGSDLDKIITNIKKFMEISASTRPMSTAVFSAISIHTVPRLEELMNIVKQLGVNVLMLTDLNFRQNLGDTIWKNADESIATSVHQAVSSAFKKGLPVLSVHGLEELGLARRYKDFLLIPPSKLYSRSKKRTWCYSPWQTLPVDVNGDITFCDCQPDKIIGNLLEQPFLQIWNGQVMCEYRQQMTDVSPPQACSICPRF